MPAHEVTVRAELDADPLGRGYAGMTDGEVSDDLVALTRESWVRVSASELLEAIVPADWAGLTNIKRANVDSVLSMGDVINVAPGSNARALLTTAFAGATETLGALEATTKRMISRAAELGCGVSTGIVAAARAL